MMKIILFYCESAGYGGMEKTLFDSATALSLAGYEVVVLINIHNDFPPFVRDSSKKNPLFINIDISHCSFLKNIQRAFSLFRQYPADIIHFYLGSMSSCQSAILGAFLHTLFTPRQRSKLLATEHSDANFKTALSLHRRILKQITILILHHIICVSRATCDNFLMNFQARRKTSVIHNAIPVKAYREHFGTLCNTHLPFDPNGKVIFVTSARLEPFKGHDVLVDAVDRITHKIPRAVFLFLGDGSMRKDLQLRIGRCGLQNQIHLIGYTTNVIDYLKLAHVFVLPSLSEGMPLSILEAMSCSLPIIATRTGGIPEQVCNHVNGLLAKPGDPDQLSACILRLYHNDEERIMMGKASYERVSRHFDIGVMIQAMCDLYESL
jgi:glycosyltransferase involved in cell wall biosynthesis